MKSITAVFETQEQAERARERLLQIGLDYDNVRIVDDSPNPASVKRDGESGWATLRDSLVPQDEMGLQKDKHVPAGTIVLGAQVDDRLTDAVLAVLRDATRGEITTRQEQH